MLQFPLESSRWYHNVFNILNLKMVLGFMKIKQCLMNFSSIQISSSISSIFKNTLSLAEKGLTWMLTHLISPDFSLVPVGGAVFNVAVVLEFSDFYLTSLHNCFLVFVFQMIAWVLVWKHNMLTAFPGKDGPLVNQGNNAHQWQLTQHGISVPFLWQ